MNPCRRSFGCMLGAALVVAASVWPAHAQAAYPDKPVTLIVPFPPGGVADAVARPLAEALGRELKQSVVVENKGGAGGALGIGAAARAPADGYTLLLSLSSISMLPEADHLLGRKPSFQPEQFKPIARITADPTVLVIRADAPWKTLEDFLADAKRRPGQVNYGSSGNYGTVHVPMAQLEKATGIKMTHIPFTGAGPAVTALLGGQVDVLASGPASVVQHIKAGKLRALAHWGDKPLTSLPEVPSLRDRGIPVQYAQWSGLFAPAAAPTEVIETLRAAMQRLSRDPAFRQAIHNTGSPLDYLDADEFSRYWAQDIVKMKDLAKHIGRLE
ncbi:Bug family tripartite tricarboxylate transporter substrate binding protein [Caldimonas aquatica]|uniref:Tripartite tricarboxylate transporter substrate binding protein n=1 Tax=Caldimonas aquatica TaxID=376175 RepID=A0ABY6MVE2_9BURK|nr:tripartite tricarboxylate transporter substrate binding protein [Schlegelella aquatica]UZD55980.1 tripartite tricarboxylate transporter substrate binding protein [Schlegelella aquatica]